jgi:hypothetical protein
MKSFYIDYLINNMKFSVFLIGLILLSSGVATTASSAIAMEAYNNHPQWKEKKMDNFRFLYVALIFAVLSILGGSGALFASFRM